MDGQIKIHGCRVEPEEIEYQICREPSVKEAAVINYDDKANGELLLAFVVCDLD